MSALFDALTAHPFSFRRPVPDSALRQAPARAAGPAFEVRPISQPDGASSRLGVEVVGLDLAQPLGSDDFARLHEAHLQHSVVVYRNQRITPAEHIAFSRRFGPLQRHVLRNFKLDAHDEILVVSNIIEGGQPTGLGDAGAYWHSDLSYKPKPALGSLLHAQELPEVGGDTLFADQVAAYDALPYTLKQQLTGLLAEHSYLLKYEELRARNPFRPKLSDEQVAEVKPAIHPVVRTHPETGRKALFVSEHFTTRIVGLPQARSDALLAELFAHSTQPQFVYRHHWQPHDLLFWDNRAVLHLATGVPEGQRRKLYRTTIEGDVPV
ncbi:TauD/TfdA dioxygenase family protein [Comamonas odontotermitis]|uniref:TauD/TfdA dioxygenase family protein n=1 Tax=Comamonas odontotermitis TaxID=379895 RepID=UPI00375065B3